SSDKQVCVWVGGFVEGFKVDSVDPIEPKTLWRHHGHDRIVVEGGPFGLTAEQVRALDLKDERKAPEPNKRLESNTGLPPPSSGKSTAVEHRLPGVSQP